MDTKINNEINNILSIFGDKYFIDGKLNKNKVIQDLENYNESLLSELLDNEIIKKHFVIHINDNNILKTNELIDLFELDQYWKDSYTKYSKKIGLSSKGNFIDESNNVVLDFPYKDTILKASMSKEDNTSEDLRPDESFLNEVITKEEIDVLLDKKILINSTRYSKDGKEKVTSISDEDNLIIKGNNLLALLL